MALAPKRASSVTPTAMAVPEVMLKTEVRSPSFMLAPIPIWTAPARAPMESAIGAVWLALHSFAASRVRSIGSLGGLGMAAKEQPEAAAPSKMPQSPNQHRLCLKTT